MKTVQIPTDYQHTSPAGVAVRLLLNNANGGIAHYTLKNNKTYKAVQHKTVSEFWHTPSGKGEIWRRNENAELITTLEAGIRGLSCQASCLLSNKTRILVSGVFFSSKIFKRDTKASLARNI